MAAPTAHRATHTPVYIHPTDDAWDVDRIERELELARLAEEGAAARLRELATSIVEADVEASPELADALRSALGDESIVRCEPTLEAMRELADMIDASPYRKREDHPVHRYRVGESRYDLATVAPWLKSGVEPTRFVLRLLLRDVRFEVEGILLSGRDGALSFAQMHALAHGLVRVEGAGSLELRKTIKPWASGKSPTLTARDIDALEAAFGLALVRDVGQACVLASREITATEKKH